MLNLLAALVLAQDRPSPEWHAILDVPKGITHALTIPPSEHPGQRLELRGRVLKADRKTPVLGIVLYFHHTDNRGFYPRPAGANPKDWLYWHGSLRGWLRTDDNGAYVLKTTRPAAYPRRTEPAHIHVYGLPRGSRTGIYFNDFVFQGDPLLTESWMRAQGPAGYVGTRLTADKNGVLQGRRDLYIR